MASEITEEDEEESPYGIEDRKLERERIMQIIQHQKSLYFSSSSSSFSSAAATNSSSFTSSRKSNTLLDLMGGGSTSLGRLFDMEHTSLGNYLKDYSASPVIKPILLWGSDSDKDIHDDPWGGMKRIGGGFGSRNGDHGQQQVAEGIVCKTKTRIKRRLIRTVSYRKLPGVSFWRCGRFKFRLKIIRRLRIMIGGGKF
ncbi:hypothetical protein F511_05502 [Dorcoceras hygrometricum]|uniref:Uncharacterized protein n=1 Tax=Dorcoceras hygrometricum TaxID=472368 RepID=A0A2Z7BGY6_9LAMI|nr:hypothetical protein F511_05502 [Dorcoceras hygrometricum]